MIKPITLFRTSRGRDFATAQEAEAHELGDEINSKIWRLLMARENRHFQGDMSLYSAAHNLAKDHPEIARRVLDALTGPSDAKDVVK